MMMRSKPRRSSKKRSPFRFNWSGYRLNSVTVSFLWKTYYLYERGNRGTGA